MDSLLADLRHAARSFARHPGLTFAAWLTLAVGIGATTAIFSIVYGVLLRPLPYPEPDRIVRLSEEHTGVKGPLTEALLSNLTYDSWTHSKTIEGISGYSAETFTVRIDNQTFRMGGASVSPSLFPLLRVPPALGRFFLNGEATDDQHLAVLGHATWTTRFGGKADTIGRTIVIDGTPHTIVGVAPPGFAFPAPESAIWIPYVMRPSSREASGKVNVFFALSRLKGNATPEQAAAEGTAAARALPRPLVADLLFGKGGPVQVHVRPLLDEMTHAIRPALAVLMAGVVLVLFIACANVANLLLSRGVDRHRELAVRVALGASGRRIARQLLVESLGLSLLGGAGGVLIGWLLVRLVPALAPHDFPRLESVRIDVRVLVFALAASIAAGIFAGLMPALRGARTALTNAMRDDDARSTTAGGAGRRVLLALEAALAVVLLVGATLLGRSFVNLVGTSSGFDATNVLTARVYQTERDRNPAAKQQLIDALITRIRAMPGVVDAGAGSMAPFSSSLYISGFTVPGTDVDGKPLVARALQYVVTPGYLRTLGLSLKAGRSLTDADTHSPSQAMLVNEAFEKAFFRNGKPPVGQRWTDRHGAMTEVVGVVGNVRRNGPLSDPEPEIYIAAREKETIRREIYLVVRTTGDPLAIAPDLRALVGALAPDAALDDVQTLGQSVAASISQPRFIMATLVAFASVALALSSIGLYGSLSYSVAQRRRELGVRAALGASQHRLIGLVVGQGMRTTVAGLAIGLIASAALAGLMSRLLFGVDPLDVASFAIAPAILLAVAIAACVVPARRAAATDPAEALRGE